MLLSSLPRRQWEFAAKVVILSNGYGSLVEAIARSAPRALSSLCLRRGTAIFLSWKGTNIQQRCGKGREVEPRLQHLGRRSKECIAEKSDIILPLSWMWSRLVRSVNGCEEWIGMRRNERIIYLGLFVEKIGQLFGHFKVNNHFLSNVIDKNDIKLSIVFDKWRGSNLFCNEKERNAHVEMKIK